MVRRFGSAQPNHVETTNRLLINLAAFCSDAIQRDAVSTTFAFQKKSSSYSSAAVASSVARTSLTDVIFSVFIRCL